MDVHLEVPCRRLEAVMAAALGVVPPNYRMQATAGEFERDKLPVTEGG